MEEPVILRGSGCPIELLGVCFHADAGLHMRCGTPFSPRPGSTRIRLHCSTVAGHDNIKTTMRYVHPREEAVEKTVRAAREFGAAGGACRMQKVGAKSGAIGEALRHRFC